MGNCFENMFTAMTKEWRISAKGIGIVTDEKEWRMQERSNPDHTVRVISRQEIMEGELARGNLIDLTMKWRECHHRSR